MDYLYLVERLFPVRRTLMEMLRDRGFLVSDDDIAMTMDQFLRRFGFDFRKEVLDFSRSKREDPSHVVQVFFVEEKLDRTTLEAYINKMNSSNVTRAIFVVQDEPNLALREALGCHYTKRLEVFWEQELMDNVARPGPRYEVLTGNEKRFVLELQKTHSSNLELRIPVTHQLARYFGLDCGDVLRITGSKATISTCVTYRVAYGDGAE